MSSNLSTATFLRNPKIAQQLLGEINLDPTVVINYETFEEAFRIRHDLIHSLICDKRGFIFGEKPFEITCQEHKLEFKHMNYFDDVRRQSPDVVLYKNGHFFILEISISKSKSMESSKKSKYALLLYFLKMNGYKVDFEVLIINPDRVSINRDSLIKVHQLDDSCIDLIDKVCENFNHLMSEVKSTPDGRLYFLQRYEDVESGVQPDYNLDDVVKTFRSIEKSPFPSEEELIKIATKQVTTHVNYDDEKFLDSIVDLVPEFEPGYTKKQEFDVNNFITKINNQSRYYTNGELLTRKRPILPLPLITLQTIDSSVRSTLEDYELTIKIAGNMISSTDPILKAIGERFMNNQSKVNGLDIFMFECRLDSHAKYVIGIEGPGRKKYLKNPNNVEHLEAQRNNTNYCLSYDTDVRDVLHLSKLLSDRVTPWVQGDDLEDCQNLSELQGFGLDYVRCCQSIYREININSLRKERKKKFILRPTGVKGVYVLIHPGAKLRVGELSSIIWFKVLISKEYYKPLNTGEEWAFRKLIDSTSVLHSDWLSVDAHRLDHYIRSYDKILMTYFSVITNRYRTTYVVKSTEEDIDSQDNATLQSCIEGDNSDLLGLIILTYMEDKRCTSKLLQSVRYLVMTSISIFKYYNDVMEKCIEPIRSPLQLYYIKKMVAYIEQMKDHDLNSSYSYGSVKYDAKTRIFQDVNGGARLLLPRPIVTDSILRTADFTEVLSEMYFCMLFNKDQDDPTHASFQILSKMLEGEVSMKQSVSRGTHFGYKTNMSDESWARYVIKSKKTHQFSARAIEVGSKLVRQHLGDKLAVDVQIACSKNNVNKTLDEFATYKSSSNVDRLYFNSSEIRQNTRRRCIEGVLELLKNGYFKSFDVANTHKTEPIMFQIFKKNQIGGVREILILTIVNRVMINILETVSRNICSFDKREILTHGPTKNEAIKDVLYKARKKPGTRMSLFLSFDKSKWGPTFIPIQFLYLFTSFKVEMGKFFYYILNLLMLHQNKRCILPERLIHAWAKDMDNTLEHRKDPNLQALKEHFLKTKEISFLNESNMGQGILHYTSSYLHSAMTSFRDELYRKCCAKVGFDHNDHDDLFSSDDSFTVMSIEVHKISLVLKKLDLFMRCQEISELLFNCRTSKAKSSINPLIGEFNSLFMSNLTFYPTTLKFAVASVHPFSTDSFFDMIKESFSATRQIVENGGSLQLYLIAHYLNKKYCESIYHTHQGGWNNLADLNISRIPYHLGYYPVFNPSLMLLFGPEYHNYLLYKDFDVLSENEKIFFINSHKIMKDGMIETLSHIEESDTMLGGLMRIEANVGPMIQLQRIQKGSMMSREEVKMMIMNDPLLLIKKPRTLQETIFKTCYKLYIPGAKEAVRSISASIYYGRVSASVSADAYYVPNGKPELKTYRECLIALLDEETPTKNFDDHIKFLYPRWAEYEMITEKMIPIAEKNRSIYEIQTVRSLSIFKVQTRLNHPISKILSYLWENMVVNEKEETQYRRDVTILKTFFPLIKDTLQETKDQFGNLPDDQKTTSVLMLILKLYSLRDRVFKGIIYGSSGNDTSESFQVLTTRNTTTMRTHTIPKTSLENLRNMVDYNKLYFLHNYTILKHLAGENVDLEDIWSRVTDDEIFMLSHDPSIGKSIKKRLFMLLLLSKRIPDVQNWTDKMSIILHYWNVRQKFKNTQWVGPYDLVLFCGHKQMQFRYDPDRQFIDIRKSDFEDPDVLYQFLEEFCNIIQIQITDIKKYLNKGDWVIQNDKVVFSPGVGFQIGNMLVQRPEFDDRCYLSVTDDVTQILSSKHTKVMACQTGLLNYSFNNDLGLPNFTTFGLSFLDIHKLGAFTRSFDIVYKPRQLVLDCLVDLEIERPAITEIARSRLGLSNEWSIAPELKEEATIAEVKEEIDTIGWLIEDDPEMGEVDWDHSDLDTFIRHFAVTDFFHTSRTSVDVMFPRQLYESIKNLKYDCVCRLTLLNMNVNSNIINIAAGCFRSHRQPILYSMISRFSRLRHSSDELSPTNVSLDVHGDFLTRFQIRISRLSDFS